MGDIVETFTYEYAYGTILEHNKEDETYNPYCYTAREFDSHDLYYYRARYYDPTLGRFISSDPIEFAAKDYNFYRYVWNDPVNWIDPSGLGGSSRAPSGQNVTLRDVQYRLLLQEYKTITGRYPDTIRAPRAHRTEAEVEGLKEEVANARREAQKANGSNGFKVTGESENNIKTVKVERKIPNNKLKYRPKKRGNAPIGEDGKPIELHHKEQSLGNKSPRDEMTRTEHRGKGNFKKNHPNTGQKPSTIDRTESSQQHRDHWKSEWDSGRFENLPKK